MAMKMMQTLRRRSVGASLYRGLCETGGEKEKFDSGTFYPEKPEWLKESILWRSVRWFMVREGLKTIGCSEEEMIDGAKNCVGRVSDCLESGDFKGLNDEAEGDLEGYFNYLRNSNEGIKLEFEDAKVRTATFEELSQDGLQITFSKVEMEIILKAKLNAGKPSKWKHELWEFKSLYSVESEDAQAVPPKPEWKFVNLAVF
ncbi:hypothetical protein NDN08_005994 [Rhodosorus marinus]|uniref:Tim44-like domain-containing protein n=1 Tax=Rhodosorus marinus TaxID=101924 RepID=A0AAV8UJI5_9RHOD|nr:hypothetical protein NDN08_005994 [Rhodosorus marinus]